LRDGASPGDVARAVAFAAALRIAHFGTSNDHSDWDSAPSRHLCPYNQQLVLPALP